MAGGLRIPDNMTLSVPSLSALPAGRKVGGVRGRGNAVVAL